MSDGDQIPHWYWRRIFLDHQNNPDPHIVFAAIGTLGVWMLTVWFLIQHVGVTLEGFAGAQATLWAAAGLVRAANGAFSGGQ